MRDDDSVEREIEAVLHHLNEITVRTCALDRQVSGYLVLRAWHATNRARRVMARARWAKAAAAVLADDVEIARLEERLHLVA